MEIKIQKKASLKLSNFDFDNFQFGVQATDHILVAAYKQGRWEEAQILPYQEISLSPLAMCFHYGQTVFEGMKAYRQNDEVLSIFRMDKHFVRMNQSLARMAMPTLPESLFVEGLKQLVVSEEAWASKKPGYSLYLRPFVIATEPRLGVKAAEEYLFMVVCSPMAAYYSQPLKVKVEQKFARAAPGGVGAAKNGGNYGASLYPTQLAKAEGFDQVIWTDACERAYMEESGTMNLMFVIDGVLITPPVGDTVLDGVTRDSLLELAEEMGIPAEKRPISIAELLAAFEGGAKVEAFGVGTAAVIAPFELIHVAGKDYRPYLGEDALMFRLKARLQAIRYGTVVDEHAWNTLLKIS